MLTHESLTLVAQHFKLADVSALYSAVGEGNISAQAVVRRVIDLHGGDDGAAEDLSEGVTDHRPERPVQGRHRRRLGRRGQGRRRRVGQARQVLHAGAAGPDPGLRHQGRRGLGAPPGLHQRGQPNNQPERLLEVEWAPTAQSTYLVNIQVEALDRSRLLSDITMALSDAHVNILSANLSTTRDRVAKTRFSFEMADATHLDSVIATVRGVPGVFDVYRVTQ